MCVTTNEEIDVIIKYVLDNPYRVETGGRLAALRTTCNIEKIKRYHHDFYHISNMLVTVCGSIDHSQLLHILSSVGSLITNFFYSGRFKIQTVL